MAQKYTQSTSTHVSSEGNKNRLHIKQNGYSNHFLHAKKNQKRAEAEARNAKYAALTTKEKFATLVVGGSKRQIAKLNKIMANEPLPVVTEKKPVKKTSKK